MSSNTHSTSTNPTLPEDDLYQPIANLRELATDFSRNGSNQPTGGPSAFSRPTATVSSTDAQVLFYGSVSNGDFFQAECNGPTSNSPPNPTYSDQHSSDRDEEDNNVNEEDHGANNPNGDNSESHSTVDAVVPQAQNPSPQREHLFGDLPARNWNCAQRLMMDRQARIRQAHADANRLEELASTIDDLCLLAEPLLQTRARLSAFASGKSRQKPKPL